MEGDGDKDVVEVELGEGGHGAGGADVVAGGAEAAVRARVGGGGLLEDVGRARKDDDARHDGREAAMQPSVAGKRRAPASRCRAASTRPRRYCSWPRCVRSVSGQNASA